MKKKLIVVGLAVCAIALAGCKAVSEPTPIAVESVSLNKDTLTLTCGETYQLTAKVKPDNADDKTIEWSSSDIFIATHNAYGMIFATGVGTATITARAGDKQATCLVTVKPQVVAVQGVSLDMYQLRLQVGETRKLTATVTPDNADDKSVAWSSSDASVATVSNDGTVTAVAEGMVSITAQAGD